jgi:hypothetical protein
VPAVRIIGVVCFVVVGPEIAERERGMTREALGEFEHMVLLAILHLGEDVYGVPIVDEIARPMSVNRSPVIWTNSFSAITGRTVLAARGCDIGDMRPR